MKKKKGVSQETPFRFYNHLKVEFHNAVFDWLRLTTRFAIKMNFNNETNALSC